jgi:hypothetical protein
MFSLTLHPAPPPPGQAITPFCQLVSHQQIGIILLDTWTCILPAYQYTVLPSHFPACILSFYFRSTDCRSSQLQSAACLNSLLRAAACLGFQLLAHCLAQLPLPVRCLSQFTLTGSRLSEFQLTASGCLGSNLVPQPV